MPAGPPNIHCTGWVVRRNSLKRRLTRPHGVTSTDLPRSRLNSSASILRVVGRDVMNTIQAATAVAIVNVFETGRVRGDYGGMAVLDGDTGHLSYGRSQASLGSGSLFALLDEYCAQPGAQFA